MPFHSSRNRLRAQQLILPELPSLPSFRVEGEPSLPEAAERHQNTGLIRHQVALHHALIDSDAAYVVRSLEQAGFEAYLVGGCVRDLLLSGTPKDFDVATNARPEDVRSLFRNCRIIGRRFRLAHVVFEQNKVIEVATFRRNPQRLVSDQPHHSNHEADFFPDPLLQDPHEVDELLIRSDNAFGEAHEDALRRDFTINALFYDLDRSQVLDWCGGMDDVLKRRLQTIGDPILRFREDPVRILRAIKFASRLDLGMTPELYDAILFTSNELLKAAKPRVFEEITRLMRGGAAHRSMFLLWETGMMTMLLPELAALLDDDPAGDSVAAKRFWRRLDALDVRTQKEGPAHDIVLWMVLIQEPLFELISGKRRIQDILLEVEEFLERVVQRVAMPKRFVEAITQMVLLWPNLVTGQWGSKNPSDAVFWALEAMELDAVARGRSGEKVNTFRESLLRKKRENQNETQGKKTFFKRAASRHGPTKKEGPRLSK